MIELDKLHSEWLSYTRLVHIDEEFRNRNEADITFGEYIKFYYPHFVSKECDQYLLQNNNNYEVYTNLIKFYYYNLLGELSIK